MSSLSVDDISSDITEDELLEDEEPLELNLQPLAISDEDSFHSEIASEDESEAASLDSELSWFQEHYESEEEDSR